MLEHIYSLWISRLETNSKPHNGSNTPFRLPEKWGTDWRTETDPR